MGEIFREEFGEAVTWRYNRGDSPEQRTGEDFELSSPCGKVPYKWTLDFKARFPLESGDVPSDILIEEYSCVERSTPGWITKELTCDFILYIILGRGRAFLMPTKTIQRKWREHGDKWKREHGEPFRARNESGNTSVNWAVHPDDLSKAGVHVSLTYFQMPGDILKEWFSRHKALREKNQVSPA